MSTELRRDVLAGGMAGLLGGLALTLASIISDSNGLLGLDLDAAGLTVHTLLSVGAGVIFGGVFRHQPGAYGPLISNGLMYALVLWIAGPLTLSPLVSGDGPAWTSTEAYTKFSDLIGHLLYGGVTGIGFYALVTVYLRLKPPEPAAEPTREPTRILILGGGFGGVSTAQELEHIFWRDPDLDIAVISQSNYLLFTPMLAEVAASALEPQHISSPVRASLPHARFRRAEVQAIDTEAGAVRVRLGTTSRVEAVPYDYLVLAVGSVPHFFDLPGMEEHSLTLKTLEDATRLRNYVITQLEQADVSEDAGERRELLTFVVAGGGFAGTEMVAELCDLVFSVLRYYPTLSRDDLRFVLVHSRDRILPELGEKLADYALRKLRARGIEFVLNARVAGARADGVLLDGGDVIPARTVVWTAGNRPNPILATLPVERSRAGAVIAEDTLRVKGLDNVWVVGDCGQIPVPNEPGSTYPPTAQHAIRQGKAAARNIAASMRGKDLKPFRFRALGVLVPLGRRTGVAEIRGMRFSGLLAWLMWRGIYITLLPGLEKKVRVLFDWAIDVLFPRDTVLTADARPAALVDMAQDDVSAAVQTPLPDTAGGAEGER